MSTGQPSSVIFLGVDLAWGAGSAAQSANETGLVALQLNGDIADAGWARGVDETLTWISRFSGHVVMAVDAPLVVDNDSGQRVCERDVGRRYGICQVK